MAWTEQQQAAINARDSSIIVSAAAGSGKTAVLTERLVQLLADPDSGVAADRIVVVTFTNDAASELKKRLDMKLRNLINEDPSDLHLLRQQMLLQSAKISTINSFCFELLRDNITDQGITSGFTVLDEADEAVLKAKSMDELLNEYSRDHFEDISLLYDKFCFRDEKRLCEVIRLADSFLSSVSMRDRWLASVAEEYSKGFEASVYQKALSRSIIKRLRRASEILEGNISLVEKIFPDLTGVKAAASTLQQARDNADTLCDILAHFERNGRPPAGLPDRKELFGRRVSVHKTVVCDRELLEIYGERRKKAVDEVIAALDMSEAAQADYEETGEFITVLTGMIRRYQEIVWQHKTEKNAISFDDGERLVLELLADVSEDGYIIQSEAAKAAADYYSIIMIDEYQDSNNKQDLIFKLLSKNYRNDENGEPVYGTNVFLVGDVKQSIYGFRLANPRNFTSTLRRSVPYTPEGREQNKAILLNKNFRSSPEVISSVNYLFSQIMTEPCGGVDYTADEYLYYGAERYGEGDSSRKTCISFITETEDDVTVSGNTEAACTAERIAKMIHAGTEVIEEGSIRRPCRPSDFCILVRGNEPTKLYAMELEARGISARGSEEKGYLTSREISVLLDLLRVISNPLLDIPLAAVMMSPMYAFDLGELAYIRTFDTSSPLFTVLNEAADGSFEGFDDMFLQQRIRELLDSLESFRLSSVTMTVGGLISYIYDTTDFISVMQLYSDGERKRANLRALVEYARNYEASTEFEGFGGLSGFIRHIDSILETGSGTSGKTPAPSGDYVSVQTLHSSKGLEYPFVFIAETSKKFRFDSYPAMFSDDGRAGFILSDKKLRKRYSTFQRGILCDEKRSEARSEELRLLYVGLTRARQQLFIDLKWNDSVKNSLKDMIEHCAISRGDITSVSENAICYADWIWASLLRNSCFGAVCDMLEADTGAFGLPGPVYEEDLFSFEICGITGEQAIVASAEEKTALPDENICRELIELINDDYDMTMSELPAKLSVTQLTKKAAENEEFDMTLQRPAFMSETGRLTGTEKGTAVHTFFQYCDFDAARNDIVSEKERMIGRGYLTERQADVISPVTVSRFFESELYRRMTAAGKVWREKKIMAAASELSIDIPAAEQFRTSDAMVKGIIDLLFEEPDGIVIADYKTDTGVSARILRERYRNQMLLYRSVVELTMHRKVKELLIYSFSLGKTISIE